MIQRFFGSAFARPLYAPPDPPAAAPGELVVDAGAAAAALVAAPVEAAPAVPAAEVAAAADATKAAPDATAPAADATKPAADAAPGKPVKDFAPSLLDEAAKPAADAKPAEPAAPDKDAAKPAADAKPPDPKEPAAKDAKAADAPKDAKAADAKPEPPAPIEYKFAFPDGVKVEDVNTERMNAFTGVLQEARVPPEKAQAMLDMHLAEVARVSEAVADRQWEVFAEQQRKSRDEVMADPELGGARHDTAIKTVMSVLDAYGLREQNSKNPRSADVIAAERKVILDDMRATGMANRASFLRMMNWVGESFIKEAKPRAAPPQGGQQKSDPASRGLRRYSGSTPASAG